jgi:hypothetical protein
VRGLWLALPTMTMRAGGPDGKPPPQVLLPRFEVKLPAGWTQQPNLGGPLTWVPKGGESLGVLQVSRINDKDVGWVSQQKDLGAYAAVIGEKLGWGKPSETRELPSEIGRAGMAQFNPHTDARIKRLWVVVSEHSAYLWTWITSVPNDDLHEQALQVVMDAREARNKVPGAVLKVIDAAEKASPARAEVAKGKSAESVHLAMLVDDKGKPTNVERPALSGRFTILPPPREKALLLELHFDAEAAQIFQLTIAFGPTVKFSLARNPNAPYSQPARLWAAQLWALVGERIDAPYALSEFEGTLLGAKLVKTRLPAGFGAPGKGEWLLFKTSRPGELYIALNLAAGIIEIFPVVPLQANDAAKALFKTL